MTNITIPKKLWAIHHRSRKPLAYITYVPEKQDSAFKKRQETGRSWAVGYCKKPEDQKYPGISFDNTPQKGFKILNHETRYSTSNVVWRVLDPRGFELEIYSGNMSQLVSNSTINQGVIQGECVWGRESGKNVLIAKGSKEYKEALGNLKKQKVPRVPMKSIKPGMTVTLRDGTKGVYYGKFWTTTLTSGGFWDQYKSSRFFIKLKDSKRYLNFSRLDAIKAEESAWSKTPQELEASYNFEQYLECAERKKAGRCLRMEVISVGSQKGSEWAEVLARAGILLTSTEEEIQPYYSWHNRRYKTTVTLSLLNE
jgi:signal recognition particle subunit SEC65